MDWPLASSEHLCDTFLGLVIIITSQYGSDYGSPVTCALGNLSLEVGVGVVSLAEGLP